MVLKKFYLLAAALTVGHGTPAIAQEVPPELDDLIPESAEDNPEEWAAQGTEDVPADPIPVEGEPDPIPELASDAELENLFADQIDFVVPQDPDLQQLAVPEDVPIPEPLSPDPEVEALAEIDAPDLLDTPDLAERQISDELVLAFPSEQSLFPLQDEFVDRFEALSSIEALDTDEDTIPQLAARARVDQELLEEMLRVYGYYDAEVIRLLSGGRREQARVGSEVDSDPRVRFDIIPGRQYVFGAIDLGVFDEIRYADFRDTFAIKPGDDLLADRIVDERENLAFELSETGFPFVEIDEPSLLIDHARYEGDLTMPVDPGGRYVFADVISSMPDFLSGKHLGRIARFERDDIYQRSLQSDLRSAILATGLVSSVTITPREITPPQGDQPGEVALDVSLEPAPLRTIAGAIGYGTEEGFRVEASWEHRNLLPPEGALRVRGVLGTREALGSVTFRRNNWLERDQVLTVEAYASDIDTEAYEARTVGIRSSFERVSNILFQKPVSFLAGAEFLYTDERNRIIGGIERPRQTYSIAGLFGSVTWDSSDNLLDPAEGARITTFLAPEASSSLDTETFYLRAQLDASIYQQVGGTVLAGRTRFATIQGAEPFQIAPSRRLYSGGGGSVRGYAFQGIGPRNDLGEPTGGGSLFELGLEARIQTGFLDGAVEVVPFVDAGTVALGSTPDFRFIQYGAGIGVRYKTSFGPIRVDVAAPLNPTEFDSPVVVYVSLGQAF